MADVRKYKRISDSVSEEPKFTLIDFDYCHCGELAHWSIYKGYDSKPEFNYHSQRFEQYGNYSDKVVQIVAIPFKPFPKHALIGVFCRQHTNYYLENLN